MRWPSTSKGCRRFVTIALPVIEPRALDTRIISSLAMPFSRASSSGTSKKKSGCTMSRRRLCCVQ
jgi:hypothetical protein